MLNKLITAAKMGETVYISDVAKDFHALEDSKKVMIHLHLDLLEEGQLRLFEIALPDLNLIDDDAVTFLKSYVRAEIYNILSSLGGRTMRIYVDATSDIAKAVTSDLNEVFGTNLPSANRKGYGRCINVIDRMLNTLAPGADKFSFKILPLDEMSSVTENGVIESTSSDIFTKVTTNLEDKIVLGIDVGGTDIKTVLVKNGRIDSYKEYDWFPAKFTESKQLIDPIVMIVKLMRAQVSLEKCKDCDGCTNKCGDTHLLRDRVKEALAIDATDEFILETIERVDGYLDHEHLGIDAIGLCFPDVVVMNKVVGGEVYKTRGIRNNPAIDYEADFKNLTDLNDRLKECIKEGGAVEICNDGPMASFTAAVELAASQGDAAVSDGVFAHTLGTELGTGWVTGDGTIPDIPLEVYNFIIDLGSYPEKAYDVDDLRSINNFNTDLPGTLQKYCSQSGVFRLAMKYFPSERPDLYQELFDLGFAKKVTVAGAEHIVVPTEPVDMRKPFLEHMMSLPERENDDVNKRIWREIGEFLAVTWVETQKLLKPDAKSRYLFGRLVKRQLCFDLMVEGAKSIVPDIQMEVANSDIAITDLMKKLEADPHYTVAQFAQAIGAVYYANRIQ